MECLIDRMEADIGTFSGTGAMDIWMGASQGI